MLVIFSFAAFALVAILKDLTSSTDADTDGEDALISVFFSCCAFALALICHVSSHNVLSLLLMAARTAYDAI